MPSLVESQQQEAQVGLRGEIATEKTKQLRWNLQREKQVTQQHYLRFQQSKRDTGIEHQRVTQADYRLTAEKHRTRQVGHERDLAGIRAGIAHDSLQAGRAERGVKQLLLREQLTALALKTQTLKEENTQAIGLFRTTFKKPPTLKSVHFISGAS